MDNLRSEKRKQNRKNKKGLKITLIVLGVLLLGIGIYVLTVYLSLTNTLEAMHQPVPESDKRPDKLELQKAEPFSVLLLGVDERKGDRGRSDTMIVLAVNPKKESIEMISIPRDTRTEIIGKGKEDKINHAYAFGGVEMSIDTVEHFLDIPIDYFIQVNMEGFKDIVDAVGGVKVNNDLDFSYGGVHFPKGEIELNGEEALLFSRMRKEDPRGDFGRQQRQRQIIQAVIREGASLNTLVNYGNIFEALGKNVKTNLTFDQMMTIQSKYKNATKAINQHQVQGTGKRIDGIYYYIVSEDERTKLSNLLKEQLEIE